MVRTTATGSLKDAGQVVSLCCEAALVGGDGLGCGGFVGKGRDREKKEEESGGESFHDNLLGMEGSRAVGKRKGRPSLSGPKLTDFAIWQVWPAKCQASWPSRYYCSGRPVLPHDTLR